MGSKNETYILFICCMYFFFIKSGCFYTRHDCFTPCLGTTDSTSPCVLANFYICNFIRCRSVLVHVHSMWQYAQSWFSNHQYTRRIKKEEESHMFMFDVLQSISLLFEMPTTTISPVSYFTSHVQPCFFM